MAAFLTVDQAAERYGKTPKALYEFLRRRPWMPGVLRFGSRIRIDPGKFEAGLVRRQKPLRRTA